MVPFFRFKKNEGKGQQITLSFYLFVLCGLAVSGFCLNTKVVDNQHTGISFYRCLNNKTNVFKVTPYS